VKNCRVILKKDLLPVLAETIVFFFVIGTVRVKENCSFRGIIIMKWKKQNPILGETKSVESIQGHRDTSPIARIKWFSLFFLAKPKIDSPDLSNTSVTDITLNVITDLM
jgi:hypothetical protein